MQGNLSLPFVFLKQLVLGRENSKQIGGQKFTIDALAIAVDDFSNFASSQIS